MRGRMNDAKSYAAPYALGEAMHGGAVGEVVESRAEGVAVGDHVLHGLGWREEAVLDAPPPASSTRRWPRPSAYLGVLGMTGLTAYAGLTRIAGLKEGDVVFVSGAAGRRRQRRRPDRQARSARAASSAARARRRRSTTSLDDLGFDAAFNYKDGAGLRPAARSRARRHRRLLRQRRRRPPRGGHRLAATRRPHRDLRRHLASTTTPRPRPARATSRGSSRHAARSRASSSATTTTSRASTPARRPAGSPTAR